MDDMDDWLAFRAAENPRPIRLTCCDCGGPAEGDISCDDGEICNACHAKDMEPPPAPPEPSKGWGLAPEPGAAYHWSARAILHGAPMRGVDVVWDRTAIEGPCTADERAKLVEWLTRKALKVLSADPPDQNDSATYTIEGDGFRLRYSPKRSYGYLYMSATAAPEVTQPTPEPRQSAPPPRARKLSLTRRR